MGTHAETASRPPTGTTGENGKPQHRHACGSAALRDRQDQPTPLATWAAFLPVEPASARRARHQTATFLDHAGNAHPVPDRDDSVLLTSELVANATKAMATAMATGSFTGPASVELSLRLFPASLLVEVTDSSPEDPSPKLQTDPEALSWRGLYVVHHLSDTWGWAWHTGHTRKTVWCTLPAAATTPPGTGKA